MTLGEVRERAVDIQAAFDDLMNNRMLAARKGAMQWRYFRQCLEGTLGISQEVPAYTPQQLAQYKFEVEDKLRRFYLRAGQPVDYVFYLVHRRDALRNHVVIERDYPEIGGYYLLVRDRSEPKGNGLFSSVEERAYLEKVVTACIDAEFEAYQALPTIDESRLSRWFNQKGAAYRDLVHTLTQLARRGWVLTNPLNPSTKRLLSIDIKHVYDGKAFVRTTEYWYLRWWSSIEGKYRYPYRETNRQTYILIDAPEGWLVDENIRPAPRSSTPHRQK